MVIVVSIVGSTAKTIENYKLETLALEYEDNSSRGSSLGNQDVLIKKEEMTSRKSCSFRMVEGSEIGFDPESELYFFNRPKSSIVVIGLRKGRSHRSSPEK
jgi:hypothetical protein